ncbi:class I SAM-dependent methyltransferase [Steroidobacter agaridevorans]|uniref:class I SAM-dependent methyltransferase n=1 Tax=Steroidobacter agaridevorans TaxID=2695856 RepID=UPI00132A8D9D|nr:class I SAM-dependent methyltransferase [Steroidobacter agaridevorans]GFE87068.1 hypothetical protein GCM10011488_20220 [Steroidobacter agaridevorans]
MRLARLAIRSLLSRSRATLEPGLPSAGGGTPEDVFTQVYREGLWGRTLRRRFYSGPGSHDAGLIQPYVGAVSGFLSSLPARPAVVDLGCGDFNVGRRIRSACGSYIACDVVADLIAYNRRQFASLDVDFRCVDIVKDPLPAGDVVFIRQVLQHLSNEQIASVVAKLPQFRYLVLTEHLPAGHDFVPNADHRHGSGIRLDANSGVVLTAPPFELRTRAQQIILDIPKYGGRITTIVYELA